MQEFWRKAELCWNRNKFIAWSLVLLGMGLALWASLCPQSPGVSIGLLAAVAGVMSVRPKMHTAEKFTWVAVLVTFAILEVLAIGRNDKTAEATRDAQDVKFAAIVQSLKDSIELSKKQYGSTIGHVDEVLQKTKTVADLSEKNLENVTGGNSFAHVTPQIGFTPMPFSIYNDGPYILSGVTVNVRRGIAEDGNPDFLGTDFQMGTLAPHQLQIIPKLFIIPHPGKAGIDIYVFRITAQNSEVEESIYFKKSATKDSEWVYRFIETRRFVTSHIGRTTNFGYHILMERPWSDGSKDQPTPKQP
jgi:hypothetical protein